MAKLKLDAENHVVLENDLPVWVLDDGHEVSYDAPRLFASVGATRTERDAATDKVKELEETLKQFGKNPTQWKAALEKIKLAESVDQSKLVDSGKMEEVINARLQPFMEAAAAEKKALEQQVLEMGGKLHNVLVSNKFGTAKAITETYLTPDLAEAKFGPHFSVEGDAVVAYRDPVTKKDKIYSRKDAGRPADFDEALEILVTSDKNYKQWKRASAATGGDAVGGESAGAGGVDLSTLSPEDRLARAFAAPKATN